MPRHPYTGALLSAVPVPNPDESDQRQQIILAGDVPSPIAPPSGCRFHPRCPKAAPVCVAEDPPLEPRLGDGPEHPAACHLPMAEGENLADFRPSISEKSGSWKSKAASCRTAPNLRILPTRYPRGGKEAQP